MNTVNNALTLLASDVLATRAKTVVDELAAANWEPLERLKEALAVYSEIRLGVAMAEQASEVRAACVEPAPDTTRSEVRS